MAIDKSRIKTEYPLPAYNYRVTIQDGSDSVMLGFSEVSGLALEQEPVTYKHGLSFMSGVSIIPGMRQPLRLSMKKGLTARGDFLQRWMAQCYAEPYARGVKRDILIDLCDESGLAVIRWSVRGALPVKMEAPTFSADGNEAAIGGMEWVAHDLKVDYHPH
jgi:phage tail-like protein